jgi:putative N6-adenine-specific DNA methylase
MPTPESLRLFAQCAPGLEGVVADELRTLGAARIQTETGGAACEGDAALIVRANLELCTATRVLLRLARFPARSLDELERRAAELPWDSHLGPRAAFRLRVTCHASRVYHSGAAEERLARALTAAGGRAEKSGEAALVLLRLARDVAELSLDTSGAPLHERGAKLEVGAAPLRETLAAGALRLAGYDGREALADPLCGAGTLVLEAARLATRAAPGLMRAFAAERLPAFPEALWRAERARLEARRLPAPPGPLWASDLKAGEVGKTRRNLERAGLGGLVALERRPLAELRLPPGPGLVIANPPWGRRLGDPRELGGLYAELGRLVRESPGWRLGLLTTRPELAARTGLTFRAEHGPFAAGGQRLRLYAS